MGKENTLPEPRKTSRFNSYMSLMQSVVFSMYEYPSLSENGIEIETLLKYAMRNGCSGVCKIDGVYKCGVLSWSGVIDDNGISPKCVLTGTDWTKEFDTDKIAYFRNYYTQVPESQLQWFAEQFAQTDLAQRALIRHSKYTPMPVASNDTEREEYEEAMRRNISGEDVTVIVRPRSNSLLQNGSRTLEDDRILNLSDPTMIEKMHFLSEYHAELKKRFGALYGMCFKSSSKSAQETTDEIHGMDNFSLIIPHIKLNELKLFADKCSELWPEDFSGSETVDFSELWKRENISAYNETVLKDGDSQEEIEEESEGENNDSAGKENSTSDNA